MSLAEFGVVALPVEGRVATLSKPPSYIAKSAFQTRDIFGVPIVAALRNEALAAVHQQYHAGARQQIVFANANLLLQAGRRPDVQHALKDMDVLNDGVAVDMASRLLHGAQFPANLNGTDFTPALLGLLAGARVFLFGGREGVAARAGEILDAWHGVLVCGSVNGYVDDKDSVVAQINDAGADVVLVALGNPHQELWIQRNASRLDARLVVGVGALFDFLSGEVPRAPVWIRRLRMEWAYRLMREPRRLVRRYTVDTAEFFLRVAWQAFRPKSAGNDGRRRPAA